MPLPRAFQIRFASTFGLALLAEIITYPLPVDAPLPASSWISLFLHFSLWLAGLLCWGNWIVKKLEATKGLGFSLALGSLFYALIAFCLAALGLLRPELRFLLFAVQAAGISLGADYKKVELKPVVCVAALPLFLLGTLFFADALVISPYWDPLHHHLASVRLFWEHGGLYFPSDAIASYQEGGFELLFLWPHFFLAQVGGRGALTVQLFCQLTHLILGYGGSLALAYALARQWLPNAIWRILALALFAAPLSLQFGIPTAKNEWGIVLWVLAGFWLLAVEKPSRNNAALAGFLWGFAWLAKLSSGFALAALSPILLFRRQSRAGYLFFALFFALGTLPLAARNFIGTGDPLFPLFPDFFPLHPGALGPTWREALQHYAENPLGLGRLAEWRQEYPLALFALLGPALLFLRKSEPSLRAAGLAPLLGLLLFSFLSGSATELRLMGALLPFSAFVAVVLLHDFIQLCPENWNFRLAVPVGSLLVLSFLLPYRWEAIHRIPAILHANELSRAYVSSEAQGWFRDQYDAGMKAALLVDTRTYHSLPIPIIRVWDSPALDAKLRATHSAREFLLVLKKEGFTHLILSDEKLDLFYPRAMVAGVETYALRLHKAIVFHSAHSVVLDLGLVGRP